MTTESTCLPEKLRDAFRLVGENAKSYRHQYANIYYLRLERLREIVLKRARRKWSDVAGNPAHVPKILDVVKGDLCYIVGTIYMDMPLKPNVLADIAKEHWLQAPTTFEKYASPHDRIMLEDASGRIQLEGDVIQPSKLRIVTGVIMAALGVEMAGGTFRVVDVCFAGMAPQRVGRGLDRSEDAMQVDEDSRTENGDQKPEWVALVSGLRLNSNDIPPGQEEASDIRLQLLIEYLQGEMGGEEEQGLSRQCRALIILGNSIDVPKKSQDDPKASKRYSTATAWDPAPLHRLNAALRELSYSLPIHILPGATDPAGAILPQQPMPRSMFGFGGAPEAAKESRVFRTESNPTWLDFGDAGMLATAGQPIDDIFKYVETTDRLAVARDTLRWRHIAPTCPDTLWCYPFFNDDPFIVTQSPSIYAIGNQPQLETELVLRRDEDGRGEEQSEIKTRVILVPSFAETGDMVYVNTRTLEVRSISFAIEHGWASG
ncbi:DNA polymerase alpha/epsilon subunit B-domain-containing protein [Cantharellus anzutake]|uniref:DNA polymerase alpha/epsilon subunit B-domain-containing protein n=1 Tax=Cantharellus anzutake TaxID=1750568 RepID=UPI001907223D|nr:DNA polymerase alpha/epsilon subunit B-domain-containing protein [Cantharellus anzutake]KAF8321416.1 DNA polymerase alpha/epsilon subunit B-domain-containing protein [Cantharellus anzutake]